MGITSFYSVFNAYELKRVLAQHNGYEDTAVPPGEGKAIRPSWRFIRSRNQTLTVLASKSAPQRTETYAFVASSGPSCYHFDCTSVLGEVLRGDEFVQIDFGNSFEWFKRGKNAYARQVTGRD
jgi:hypothetical protein